MNKVLKFSEEARKSICEGVEIVSKAVKETLGPQGRTVIMDRAYGDPKITKDGVSVAEEIVLEDRFKNLGVKLITSIAGKTRDVTGDGTTTSTIIAESLILSGMELINQGYNSTKLKKELTILSKEIISKLDDYTSKVEIGSTSLKSVATISSNNDHHLGELISEAYNKIGLDGVISLEESKSSETYLELVDGLKFDRGYFSPYFINNQRKKSCEFNNPFILLIDYPVRHFNDILPYLEYASRLGRPILILSDTLDLGVINNLVANKLKGVLDVCVVNPPYFTKDRSDFFDDLALITGSKVISQSLGMDIEDIDLDNLGESDKITVTQFSTTIIGDKDGSSEDVKNKIDELKSSLESEDLLESDKEFIKNRISYLSGGVAIIKIGGSSEVEVLEKKDRLDDAIGATKAAIAEGFLPGGGTVLLRVSEEIYKDKGDSLSEGEIMLLNAIRKPFQQLLINSGFELDDISSKLLESEDKYLIYDFLDYEFVNAIDKGIIEPKLTLKMAIENSVSVASLVLTTSCAIVDDPDKNQSVPLI